jgi:hypothetical protein
MSKCPSRPARVRHTAFYQKTCTRQPLMYVVQKGRLAAKQMCSASDVQHKPVYSLKPDPRAVPFRPSCQNMQKPLVPNRISRMALQIRTKGPRI